MNPMARVEAEVEIWREVLRKIERLNKEAIRKNPDRWRDGGGGPLAHGIGHLKGQIEGLRKGSRLVARDVAAALVAQGLSQTAVAQAFSVSQGTISRWLSGSIEEEP